MSDHISFLLVSSRELTFSSALSHYLQRIRSERAHPNLHILYEHFPNGQNSPAPHGKASATKAVVEAGTEHTSVTRRGARN